MRTSIAIVLALHGLVHLIGFVVPWRLATIAGFPYGTASAWAGYGLGNVGAKLLGFAWLLVCVGFVVAAVGLATWAPWAILLLALDAAASIVLCAGAVPAAAAGLVVDVLILGALFVLRVGLLGPIGSPREDAAPKTALVVGETVRRG